MIDIFQKGDYQIVPNSFKMKGIIDYLKLEDILSVSEVEYATL
jgi:hypothetical protein